MPAPEGLRPLFVLAYLMTAFTIGLYFWGLWFMMGRAIQDGYFVLRPDALMPMEVYFTMPAVFFIFIALTAYLLLR